MINNPIVASVRHVREEVAAAFGDDVITDPDGLVIEIWQRDDARDGR
jgi:hypothetical protein